METTINFDDYLSEEEKKAIIQSVFERYAQKEIIESHERIFSNAAYHICFKMVQEAFDGDVEEIIVENTKRVISELTSHTVFRRKESWEHEQSKGFVLLNQAVENQKDILEKKVAKIFSEIEIPDLKMSILEVIEEVVKVHLFGGDHE